jgi:hypothetical protein
MWSPPAAILAGNQGVENRQIMSSGFLKKRVVIGKGW